MRPFKKMLMVAGLLLGVAPLAQADTAWSGEDYDLHPGDFNGDGLSDLLYVARDARHLNGIALGDGAGARVDAAPHDLDIAVIEVAVVGSVGAHGILLEGVC